MSPDPGESPGAGLDPDGGPTCSADSCGAGQTCCGESCSTDPTCSLSLSGMSRYHGYVGGGNYVELTGTGFSSDMRVYIGDGRAPLRVLSDTSAMIMTPPAVEGSYDVRVETATNAASLPEAYTYHQYGFTDQWVKVDMSTARGNFPAMSTLHDGRVLIIGGTTSGDQSTALTSAEIFDPVTKTTSVVPSQMQVPRFTVSATTMLDGRVLVLGVCNGSSESPSYCLQWENRSVAEVFDPATGAFSTLTSRLVDSTRYYLHQVLLPNGHVLIQSAKNGTLEEFNPDTNTFSLLSVSSSFGAFGRPARLRDGRVAFLSENGVEVFDPDTMSIVETVPSNLIAGGILGVYTIPDGRVVSAGGSDDDGSNFVPRSGVVVFDPQQSTVTGLGQQLSSPRTGFASALLRDGTVMVASGINEAYPKSYACLNNTFALTSDVDVIDANTGAVSPFTPMPEAMMGGIATTLLDGSILIGGGGPCGGTPAFPYLYYLESVETPID